MEQLREFIGATTIEAAGGDKLYRAKISQVNRVNQNRRLLPESVMRRELARLGPLLKAGRIAASLDHLGYADGGNFKDTCALWKEMTLESDGSVIGRFSIVPTSRGKDLQAMLDSGVSIGFSTYSRCSLRRPSATEKRQWGIGDDTQIYCDDLQILAVDCVSDPSVADALLLAESRSIRPRDERAEFRAKWKELWRETGILGKTELERKADWWLERVAYGHSLREELLTRLQRDGEKPAREWLVSKAREYSILLKSKLQTYDKHRSRAA